MDTELLRTFLEVRNTRHFGRAAQNLFITQAAVSARIRQLEEALGAPLFIRSRNNIQLSSEGERLVPHAETVLRALARARQDIALQDAGSSQIYLGVRAGVWDHALQQKLYALRDGEPGLLLRLDSHEPDDLVRKLLDRTLDMAILYDPPSVPELRSLPAGELILKLYSSDTGQSAHTATAGDYIYLDWGGGFSRFHARRYGDPAVPILHTNILELARGYLADRGGSCFLPVSLDQTLAALGLLPVPGVADYKLSLRLVYHSGSRQRELIERVASYLG